MTDQLITHDCSLDTTVIGLLSPVEAAPLLLVSRHCNQLASSIHGCDTPAWLRFTPEHVSLAEDLELVDVQIQDISAHTISPDGTRSLLGIESANQEHPDFVSHCPFSGTSSSDETRSLSGTESPSEESSSFDFHDLSTCSNSPYNAISLSGATTPEERPTSRVALFDFDTTSHASLLPSIPPPTSHSTFTTLPTELHLLIFSHLDPLDSMCLGLTASHFYRLQRYLHGSIPLSTRRKGPNTLERAWRVPGKQDCRHCGVYRCQLHMHLTGWMPEGWEYCPVRQVYCARKGGSARRYCYRRNPLKPGYCGRHPVGDEVPQLERFTAG